MKSHELLSIPLNEKVYVTEVYQDRSSDLIAVGLRSSVVILNLKIEESESTGPIVQYEIVQSINHDSRVQCLAWSPETTLTVSPRCIKFATGGADHNVRLFTTDLGQNESLRVLRGHRDYVNAIAFHPEADGDQLVSGSDDHTIALWNCTSGQHQHTVTFDSPVMSVIWHPEELSKLMIGEKNGVIHIFNIVTYNPILSLDCGSKPLLAADWSLSNSLIIAAAVQSEVTLFDTSKMAPVSKRNMRQDTVKSVKIAPFSDAIFATAGQPNFSVKISSTKNSQSVPVVANEPIAGMSWHAKRSMLVVGHNEKVTVYQVSTR